MGCLDGSSVDLPAATARQKLSQKLAVQATPACITPVSCIGHGHCTQVTLYAWPASAGHTVYVVHIQDRSSPGCIIGYKADLLVYIHVIYNFILDVNRRIHFAVCVCFIRLKSSGPVGNGFVAANKADLLTQNASQLQAQSCKHTYTFADAFFSKLHKSMQY